MGPEWDSLKDTGLLLKCLKRRSDHHREGLDVFVGRRTARSEFYHMKVSSRGPRFFRYFLRMTEKSV